ncbi:hypothetical protein BDW59DRAFT_179036 [Aspergillus cavernicola]|uniref:P-loop containing nucleoside triphosphate hydrolase protein n=1 Tax=Aspergillus cavernicola TaxID=176166 RepID=A0ABR4ILW8_9EURO
MKLQSQARAYQLEMFNLSRQQNIIVAMGTGTGKTALLRITEEIRTGSSNKLIWFLCPTVALCEQHLISISMHIPSMCSRSFTSNDNIDHWKDKNIWDAALSGIRVAVSTYQVLFDALSHGFVRIDRLSLLIFDEAHNCIKKSAANKIMEQFYFPQKETLPTHLPKILGLSASPVISKPSTLKTIERNLDSICKSPTRHYSQLLEFANLPSCQIEQYSEHVTRTEPDLLINVRRLIEISPDRGTGAHKMRPLLELIAASESVNAQLGSWAATRYMTASIKDFKARSRANAEMQLSFDHGRDLAMEILCQLGILPQESLLTEEHQMSSKCLCLLRTLSRVYSDSFCGLIFVRERSTVFALKAIIENYPHTRDRFRCGAFVGLSNFRGSSRVGDLHDTPDQAETLRKFRNGYLNLIITTDALEEGIDVPACNTVISLDRPLTLKSFIQRRGRARQKNSVFINIVGDTGSESILKEFQKDEKRLIEIYKDENRREEALEKSNDKHNGNLLSFRVERTSAQITMHESVAYLHNFCASLPSQAYVTNRPDFIYRRNSIGLIQATAQLPRSLDPSLHEVSGSRWWSREKLAKEDAALQAYVALFNAHLVNEHLVPSQPEDILGHTFASKSHYNIPAQYDPWADAAQLWNKSSGLFSHQVRISRPGNSDTGLVMIMPICVPFEIRIPLFVQHYLTYTATIGAGKPDAVQDISIGRQVTRLILGSVFGSRLPSNQDDFINMFVRDVDHTQMELFLSALSGTVSLANTLKDGVSHSSLGLLRDTKNLCLPRVVKSSLPPTQEYHAEGITAATLLDTDTYPLPWRCNFLRTFGAEEQSPVEIKPKSDSPVRKEPLSIEDLVVDRLPFQYSETALFIPSINHEVGVYLMAERLCQQFFPGISFQKMDLLATALRPSCTERPTQFQFIAFLGDTVFRFIVAKQLFLHHPLWYEGLLSKLKAAIVSDSGLAQATIYSGLAKYLRRIGAATLADMTKAVIGAAYISNGLGEASRCAAAIVPRFKGWHETSLHDGDYMKTRLLGMKISAEWEHLETLLGHSFIDKSLLVEAMTHLSYIGSSQTTSYGRLSFLGSSVLDMIVVDYLHRQCGHMTADRLQSLKTAVTNNKILAFFCVNFETEIQQKDVITDEIANIRTTVKRYSLNMRNFLQIHDQGLAHQLSELISSTNSHRIQKALQTKKKYPWVELADFAPLSLLSDIVQSIFGAIYVDSQARLHDCERLAQRIGIVPLLQDLIERKVVTDHPKRILRTLQNIWIKEHSDAES